MRVSDEPKKTHKLECNEQGMFSIIDEEGRTRFFAHLGAISGAFLASSKEGGKELLVMIVSGYPVIRDYENEEEVFKVIDFIFERRRDYIRACTLDSEASAKRSSYSLQMQEKMINSFKRHMEGE